MKPIMEISADTRGLQNYLDLSICYLSSAEYQYATAFDQIAQATQAKNKIGQLTREYWNQLFIPLIFCYRHALELAIKAFIKETTGKDKGKDKPTHDIEKLWKDNISGYQKIIPEKINRAFRVLKKHHLLKNAQLYRYPVDNHGLQLKNIPPIENEGFEAISDAVLAIQRLVLECIHLKKGLFMPKY